MRSIVCFLRVSLRFLIFIACAVFVALFVILRNRIKNRLQAEHLSVPEPVTSKNLDLEVGPETAPPDEQQPLARATAAELLQDQPEAATEDASQVVRESLLQPDESSNVQEAILPPPADTSAAHTGEQHQASEPKIEAYCVKCRQKRIMLNPGQITTKNGRKAMEGTCPVCGTRLFRFI